MPNTVTQIKKHLVNQIKFSKYCDPWFYEEHLLVVEKLALDLCKLFPEANQDAMILSVWFHDIGRAHGHDKGHDLYGAEYAREVLSENDFDQKFIDIVTDACRTHSCDEHGKPGTLEGKILATADALSHYHNGFYLRIFNSWSKQINPDHYPDLADQPDYQQLKTKLFKKMKRDLDEKIFFAEARAAVLPMYQAWQQVIEEVRIA